MTVQSKPQDMEQLAESLESDARLPEHDEIETGVIQESSDAPMSRFDLTLKTGLVLASSAIMVGLVIGTALAIF